MPAEKTYEWLKPFLSDKPGGHKTPPSWREMLPLLRPALDFQELMLGLTRQAIAGEGSRRALHDHLEEMMRTALETWQPFFAGERAARKLALEAQSGLLELYGQMLRSLRQEPPARS